MKYFFLLSLILSGCVSHEEIIAKEAAYDNQQCVSKGFTPNTDTYRLCLDNRSVERIARSAKVAAENAADAAENARLGATYSCIYSGGIMAGSTCLK